MVVKLGHRVRDGLVFRALARSKKHVLDAQRAETGRPDVRLELDEEPEHVEAERAVRSRPRDQAPSRPLADLAYALQVLRPHSQIDVLNRPLPRIGIKEVRRHDALHRKHVDAAVTASHEHALER